MKDLKAERVTIDPQTGKVTVMQGRELFPGQIFCPVKQDDIKGTSGSPEGL